MADFYGPLAGYYDTVSPGMKGDEQFYVAEAEAAGSPVLELGCGTGRLLIPIAAKGVQIVGLDLSPEMLAIARHKVEQLEPHRREHISIAEGDMRDFALDMRFQLAIIPYRAFLHLLTPDDQRTALLNIRRHLVPGGKLIFNIFDPSVHVLAGRTSEPVAALTKFDDFSLPDGRHMVVWDNRQYNLDEQLVTVRRIFEELDAEGRMVQRTHSEFRMRYLFRWETEYLLELCGYKVESLYGDFKRGPFRHGQEQIWIASAE